MIRKGAFKLPSNPIIAAYGHKGSVLSWAYRPGRILSPRIAVAVVVEEITVGGILLFNYQVDLPSGIDTNVNG
jgi:hypothetical protein